MCCLAIARRDGLLLLEDICSSVALARIELRRACNDAQGALPTGSGPCGCPRGAGSGSVAIDGVVGRAGAVAAVVHCGVVLFGVRWDGCWQHRQAGRSKAACRTLGFRSGLAQAGCRDVRGELARRVRRPREMRRYGEPRAQILQVVHHAHHAIVLGRRQRLLAGGAQAAVADQLGGEPQVLSQLVLPLRGAIRHGKLRQLHPMRRAQSKRML
mmetsp:Transcript_16442/g.28609  ORF Transcript_16442/g.28609 Transcript_16442/m.28609 type:complete len:213 (+) Transcript_16442:387-1025(+)